MGNKSKEDAPRFKIFRKFKGYGYIDKTGKEVIPCRFYDTGGFFEGLARVLLADKWGSGKWGFIDKSGKEVIPFIYDGADDFCEGLVEVSLDGKSGYIDKSGKEVIPCKYDNIRYHEPGYFSEGLAEVRLDDSHWAWIDKKGKEVVVFDER